ncbi:MAG: hypothetical protein L6R39_004002 [Caloplaca ligustica]|nr:MAG: hypothetical protein L6R39_004002 [Caloplaca ligustica]
MDVDSQHDRRMSEGSAAYGVSGGDYPEAFHDVRTQAPLHARGFPSTVHDSDQPMDLEQAAPTPPLSTQHIGPFPGSARKRRRSSGQHQQWGSDTAADIQLLQHLAEEVRKVSKRLERAETSSPLSLRQDEEALQAERANLLRDLRTNEARRKEVDEECRNLHRQRTRQIESLKRVGAELCMIGQSADSLFDRKWSMREQHHKQLFKIFGRMDQERQLIQQAIDRSSLENDQVNGDPILGEMQETS